MCILERDLWHENKKLLKRETWERPKCPLLGRPLVFWWKFWKNIFLHCLPSTTIDNMICLQGIYSLSSFQIERVRGKEKHECHCTILIDISMVDCIFHNPFHEIIDCHRMSYQINVDFSEVVILVQLILFLFTFQWAYRYHFPSVSAKWSGHQNLWDCLFAVSLGDALDSTKKLSRHCRWVYPSDSGWTATFKGTLKMPIEDTSSSLGLAIPFTYSFDSGT